MAIGIRASGSVTYDLTHSFPSTTVTKPAAAAAGDVAVMVVSGGKFSGAVYSLTAVTGWTPIAVNVGGTATPTEVTSVFYRVIQAGDSTWAVPISAPTSIGIVFQAFTGVDTTTPIDATGTTATNAESNTIDAPSVTVVTDQAWELIGCGTFELGLCTVPGFTKLENGDTIEYAGLYYNTTPRGVGPTGTVTITSASNAAGNTMSVVPFALRPAGVAQTPIVDKDSGAGAEATAPFLWGLVGTDSLTGSEIVGLIAVTLARTDSLAGSEVVGPVAATLARTDSGTGAEATTALLWGLVGTDSITGSEVVGLAAATLAGTDSITGVDVVGPVATSLARTDSLAGSEVVGPVAVTLAGTDSGAEAEAPAPLLWGLAGTDSLTGSDVIGPVAATLSLIDSGAGAEATAPLLWGTAGADSLTGSEVVGPIAAALAGTDSGSEADTTPPPTSDESVNSIASTDSGVGGDVVTRTVILTGGHSSVPNLVSITLHVTIRRTTGPVPFVLQANASDTTVTFSDAGAAFLAQVGRAFDPYLDLGYAWDFGDASGAETMTNTVTGATVNANTDQTGPEAAYIYRTAGTYTITLSACAWDGSNYVTASTTTLWVDEVQQTRVAGVPTGGTYTLSFGGQTTAAIAYNATAAQVRAALEALSSIGTGNVRETGYGFYFEFIGTLAGTDVALMTADASGLTGGTSPTVVIRQVLAGATATTITPTAWAGTDQYFDSAYDGSNGAGNGTISRPYTTFTDLKNWIENGDNRRALLKRGSSFDSSARLLVSARNKIRVEAYGTGAAPLLSSLTGSGPVVGQSFYGYDSDDVVFTGIAMRITTSNSGCIWFTRAGFDNTNSWFGVSRNYAFLDCAFTGVLGVQFNSSTYEVGSAWTFWRCQFTRDTTSGKYGKDLLVGLGAGLAVVGCSFSVADGDLANDHYISATILNHSLYRWIDFQAGTALNYCINSLCRVDGIDAPHVLVDSCNIFGTKSGIGTSNSDNTASEGRFNQYIIQNSAIHVGQVSTGGIGWYTKCLKNAVARDNLFWANPGNDVSLNDTTTHLSFYRNKVWRSATISVSAGAQASGYFHDNQLMTTADASSNQSLVSGPFTTLAGWFFDNDSYYSPSMISGGSPKPFYNSTLSARKSFAEWQALGFDPNGSYADPHWRDPVHGDFAVGTVIVAVDSGVGTEVTTYLTWGLAGSDSGLLVEAVSSVAADLAQLDSGIGADATTALLFELAGTDSCAGSDVVGPVAAALSLFDSGVGAEATTALLWGLTGSDSLVGSDVVGLVAAALTEIDSGTGADATTALLLELAGADSLVGSDVVGPITVELAGADSLVGSDVVGLVAVALTEIDSGTGTDATPVPLMAQTGTDSGTGSEAFGPIAAELAGTDSPAGSEVAGPIAAELAEIDSVTGAEVAGPIALTISGTDSGTGADAATTPASMGVQVEIDSGTGAEAVGSVAAVLAGTDSGTGADVVGSVAAVLAGTDSGTGADAAVAPDTGVSTAITSSDSGVGSEVATTLPTYINGGPASIPNLVSITLHATIRRTTGPIPFVIQASAADTTVTFSDSGAAFLAQVGRDFDPYLDLGYSWNFGDASGVETMTNPVTGLTVNANIDQTGPEAAYVYRTAGTYTITLSACAWNGSSYITASTTTLWVDEIQQTRVAGVPTGGTYTLSFGGQTTAAIAYNATAAQVRAALEAISSIGTGNVRETGYGFYFEFIGTLAGTDVALMTADASGLTGGTSPTVVIRQVLAGATATTITPTAWAGTDQYFDSAYDGSNGAGNGTISRPYTTFTDLKNWIENGDNRRALLKRGSSFDSSARLLVSARNKIRVEAYGTGAAPLLSSITGQGAVVGQSFYGYDSDDVVFSNIAFRITSSNNGCLWFSRAGFDNTNAWFGVSRNYAFLDCAFIGNVGVQFNSSAYEVGSAWTFWRCPFTRDATSGSLTRDLLIGLGAGLAVVGGSFSVGEGGYPYISATILNRSLYRWIDFQAALAINYCIYSACRTDGIDVPHVLVDGCNVYGSQGGIYTSNADNVASEGRFNQYVIQNSAIHVGQSGSGGVGWYINGLKNAVARDNLFWANPGNDVSLGDTTTHASFYRNKVWRSTTTSFAVGAQASGYFHNNQLMTTADASGTATLITGPFATLAGWFFDNDLYYSPNMISGGSPKPFYNSTLSARKSFAEWQALGFDTNGSYADPHWRNPSNGDFAVVLAVAAVDSGVGVEVPSPSLTQIWSGTDSGTEVETSVLGTLIFSAVSDSAVGSEAATALPSTLYGGHPSIPNLVSIAPHVVLRRTTGAIPFVFQANATDTTAAFSDGGAAFLAQVGRAFAPHLDLEYTWDFGDESGVETMTNPVTGLAVNANVNQTGPEASYVYRNTGTYTITLSARGWNGSSYVTASTTTLWVDEIQQIRVAGVPTGGTYTLSFDGQTTSAIAYNATPAQVRAALEALSSIGTGNVRETGYGLYFEFTGTLSGTAVVLMTSDASGLTGGTSPTVPVRRVLAGATTSAITPTAWAGTDQYFDSAYDGSNGTSNGTISRPYTTFSALKTWVENGDNRRALLKRGSSFDSTARLLLSARNNMRVEAYGTGAAPLLSSLTGTGPVVGVSFYGFESDDVVFDGIAMRVTTSNNGCIWFTGATVDNTNAWFGVSRNYAFLDCAFTGNCAVQLRNSPLYNVEMGSAWTFWRCQFTRDTTSGEFGQSLLIALTAYSAIVGCDFSVGDGDMIRDHYIYPSILNHSLYRWINFHPAVSLNFCINTNCRTDGNIVPYVLVDGCNITGTQNGMDGSNSNNDPTEGQFDQFIVQNNAYHVGQIGSQGIGWYSTCLKRAVARDNMFWANPGDDLALGDPATHLSFYRNKIWKSSSASIAAGAQTAGYIHDNQLMTTADASGSQSLVAGPFATLTGWHFDNDTYYSPNMISGGSPKPFYNSTLSARKSFAEWQALGLDTHGSYEDPHWRDPAHGDFAVVTGTLVEILAQADAGSGSDGVAPVVAALSRLDSGVGTDATPDILCGTSASDSLAGSEAAGPIAAALSLFDSGVETDATTSLLWSTSVSDSFAGSEAAGPIAAALSLFDSGVGAEVTATLLWGMAASDSLAGSETIGPIAAALSLFDSGTEADATTALLWESHAADSGLESDFTFLSAAGVVVDSGTVADFGTLSASSFAVDVGSEADSSSSLTWLQSSNDLGTGSDWFGPVEETGTVPAVSVDAGTGSDSTASAAQCYYSTDSGSVSEPTTFVAAVVASSDAGSWSETLILIVTAGTADSGAGAEAAALEWGRAGADSVAGSEVVGPVAATLSLLDSGAGADAATALLWGLAGADPGRVTEAAPGVSAAVSLFDAGSGADTTAPLVWGWFTYDSGAAFEVVGPTGVTGIISVAAADSGSAYDSAFTGPGSVGYAASLMMLVS